jgi:hypothetical protein
MACVRMRTKTRMKRWKIGKIRENRLTHASPFHTQVSVLLNKLGEQFEREGT